MSETVTHRVISQVAATNAARAQFLGLAFAATYLAGGLADAWGMGTLRNHGFMLGQLVGSLAVAAIVRWTPTGRRHADVVFALGMCLVSASGAAHLAQFGGLDGPWFYGSYTAPPVFIPILLPLALRIVASFAAVGGFAFVYWFFRPDLFDHPMAHIPVVYLVTVSAISIGIGHYVFRLERASFSDAARFEEAAAVLEAQLRAGDAAPAHLRREIARQLHDDVAQLITGARIQLDGWSRGTKEAPAARLADLLDELARRANRMLVELRTPPERGPLVEELERLRTEYAALGLSVDLLVDETFHAAAPGRPQVDVFLSSAREALTNAVRHGGASEATVNLHAAADTVSLEVLDNGRGRAGEVHEGHGLMGIRERVQALGGTAELTDYEEGLRLAIRLPREAA